MVDTKPRFRVNADGTLTHTGGPAPTVSVDSLGAYNQGFAPAINTVFDGDKFPGGFGPTQIQFVDYWTLRERSSQLFNDNLYAKGLIRRLVTNEINTGLTPEASPDERVLGLPLGSLAEWTDLVESRYALWADDATLCDFHHQQTLAELQQTSRREALIEGDVLIVMHHSQRTQLPMIELVPGRNVMTPIGGSDRPNNGNVIEYGVEMDANRRVVAHWVRQDDGTSKRVPAWGSRSGRRVSWLVYGTERRHGAVRGEPLLSTVLQSLKEIDRYRDSAQRKAVVNSILAMFIEKNNDKPGTLPMQGGAVRRDTVGVADSNVPDRKLDILQYHPGMVVQELQQGERPVAFQGGTDVDFGAFEESIVQSIAWANQIPPEILRLAFSNNYSASQAAINEFKIYLNMVWGLIGSTFCQPIYKNWLLSEALLGRIEAPGLLDAWRDGMRQDIVGAWMAADWYGTIKPSTDMVKAVRASRELLAEGLTTRAREARITTGTKYGKNVQRLARENEQLQNALAPLLTMQEQASAAGNTNAVNAIEDKIAEIMGDARDG